MSITRTNRWRLLFVAAGATMALGGPLHPESDAKDSLRDELATMTSGDTWVLSHSLIAIGTALLAIGLWSAYRSDAWPRSTRTALRVTAVTMSLHVIETIFHLASVVDSSALAAGDPAPIAFAHVGLALVLYPVSGLSFAWLSARLFGVVGTPEKVFGIVGVAAGVIHAVSVPATVVFPDAELTPMFASAGMLFAGWSLGLGISGLRTVRAPQAVRAERAAAYRSAERALWRSLDVEPTEREVELHRLGTRVRIQELGEGAPIVFIHGGPSAGTNWAPLAARLDGFRSIIVDRPGSGLSDALAVEPDGLCQFADVFLVDLLDALGLERAHVVASSFGGSLALRAAAVAPERVERMVQMACPAGAPGMAVPSFMRAAAVPVLRRLITSLPPNERAARSMLRQIGHGATLDADGISRPFMDWYLALQRDTDTMRNDMALVGSLVTQRGQVHPALELSEDLLGRVEVPTHFFWGADDPFGGEAVAVRTVAEMPDASLEMVVDAGHLPWLDDPQRAASAVRRFLAPSREHPAAATPAIR